MMSESSSDFACTEDLAKQLITWSLHSDLKVNVSIQTRIPIQIVH